jgi:hypothetical protein
MPTRAAGDARRSGGRAANAGAKGGAELQAMGAAQVEGVDGIAPEYHRFVAQQQGDAAGASRAARLTGLAAGDLAKPLRVDPKAARELFRVATREASGFVRPGGGLSHPEVLWVDGDNELAVQIARASVRLGDGTISVRIPVRCDQCGDATVEVLFVTGTAERPAGLYAAAQRRPRGPEVVVATWGDSLVAFAWESVLGMVAGLTAAVGKDARGNLLVPAEMTVSPAGLVLLPMARHRFAGGSGLKTTRVTVSPINPKSPKAPVKSGAARRRSAR